MPEYDGTDIAMQSSRACDFTHVTKCLQSSQIAKVQKHFVICLLSVVIQVLLAGQPVQVIRVTLHALDKAKICLCSMSAGSSSA